MRRRYILVLLATMLVAASTSQASAQGQRSNVDRALVVCMLTSPAFAVSAAQKATIQSEVNAIWNMHGVSVKEGWEGEDCDRLIAVKSDLEARPEDASPPAALAWILFVQGQARLLMFVRVGRARDLLDGLSPGSRPEGLTNFLVARLVGRSVAHELGHLLLNNKGHTRTGLMRDRYRAQDVLNATPADYALTAQQRTRLFGEYTAATRVARR